MKKTKSPPTSAVLNLRISLEHLELLNQKAAERNITVSAFARSLLISAMELNLNVSESPSPSLDKLSFKARKYLLHMFEAPIAHFFDLGLSVEQIEHVMVDGIASTLDDFKEVVMLNRQDSKANDNE